MSISSRLGREHFHRKPLPASAPLPCFRGRKQHFLQKKKRDAGGCISTRCTVAADPEAYGLSYDSDDEAEGPSSFQSLSPSTAEDSGHLQDLAGHATPLWRVRHGFLVAVHTFATAPQEVWRSVKVTAGAASDLIRNSAERGVRDMARDKQQEGHTQQDDRRVTSPVGRTREKWKEAQNDMPEGTWGKIQWLWEQPPVKKLRITISMAQWSVRLPAIMALLATQMGLLASQVSLPMLAPLLLGTGMMLRSIRSNASIIFPRICVLVVLLYVLWFANSVVQNTVVYLRRQGAVDARVSGAIITASECCALLAAMVIVLSMIGVNVSGLLLPAGIALAFAAKDLSHNFLAGFFLFAVQPFKLGDRISVSYSSAAAVNSVNRSAWFEGICEKVDLRYTIVKNGPRRLFVPNSAFLTREFMVMDSADSPKSPSKRDLLQAEELIGVPGLQQQQPVQPPGYGGPFPATQRPVWAQAPQQQPQPYSWMRPPYEGTTQQQAGPSRQAPEQAPKERIPQWPGRSYQAELAQQQQHYHQHQGEQQWQQADAAQADGQEYSNVTEWQRRQSGSLKSQRPPDKKNSEGVAR